MQKVSCYHYSRRKTRMIKPVGYPGSTDKTVSTMLGLDTCVSEIIADLVKKFLTILALTDKLHPSFNRLYHN